MRELMEMDGWTLIEKETAAVVRKGDLYETFRGEQVSIRGGRPPHKQGSTGRIWVDSEHGLGGELFPGVCGLVWIQT